MKRQKRNKKWIAGAMLPLMLLLASIAIGGGKGETDSGNTNQKGIETQVNGIEGERTSEIINGESDPTNEWQGLSENVADVLNTGEDLLPAESELIDTAEKTGGVDTSLEIHFIDVGQGDATLIKCGDAAMLIDAAENSKGTLIQNYLQKQGIKKLDYLILTHPDADHIGGAAVVITKFEIDTVFMSNFEKDNKTYRNLLQTLSEKRLSWSMPEIGSSYTLGESTFTIVGPVKNYENPNDASIALRLEFGNTSFLFSGDAEEGAEADILATGLELQADVYKVGHHGSKSSSSLEFLDAINPTYAVISCEEGNSYGHPHAQTMNSLRERGISVYRTDEQGSLIVTSDGNSIQFNSAPSDTFKAGEPTGSGQTEDAKKAVIEEAEVTDNATQNDVVNGTVNNAVNDTTNAAVNDTTNAAVNDTTNAAVNDTANVAVNDTATESVSNDKEITYILNTSTKKFHKSSCSYLPTTNRKDTTMSRDEIIQQGYAACKKCNP
ncbi:MBL fold metallo-hydrolase [Lachnospiraceae bacterium OttesenSCG-928-D06]|nr:MBL fold metallo-hydrolase [Lachnospiraceae bacterium OttesenSCG-928-D06]